MASGSEGQPVGLSAAQLGDDPVRRASPAIAVRAWVPFTSGRFVQVMAYAGEWTSKAVRIRWRAGPELFDLWVWAPAVTRYERPRIVGPPATHRPGLRAVGLGSGDAHESSRRQGDSR